MTIHQIDKLRVGPNLQNELFDILLRFRAHQFIFSADIEAMFRQILIMKEDLQKILESGDRNQHSLFKHILNVVT